MQLLHLLVRVVRKFLLQRTKTGVLGDELKGKDDIIVFCEMTPLQVGMPLFYQYYLISVWQRRLYQHILSLPDIDNARYFLQPCPCGSRTLRKACCEMYKVPYKRSPPNSCEIDST
jgi:SNF2 family DNA or RNA helicase